MKAFERFDFTSMLNYYKRNYPNLSPQGEVQDQTT